MKYKFPSMPPFLLFCDSRRPILLHFSSKWNCMKTNWTICKHWTNGEPKVNELWNHCKHTVSAFWTVSKNGAESASERTVRTLFFEQWAITKWSEEYKWTHCGRTKKMERRMFHGLYYVIAFALLLQGQGIFKCRFKLHLTFAPNSLKYNLS